MTSLFITLTLIAVAVCGLLFIPALQARRQGERAGLLKPALLSLVLIISSLSIYSIIGSPRILPKLAEYEDFDEEVRSTMVEINAAIKNHPNDAKLYADLGEAHASIQQFPQAREAYRAAVLLSKGNPEYIMALGRTEMAVADGQVNEEAKKAFEMVLLQDKTNIPARYYLALGKKQSGDVSGANKDFEELLKELPEGIPLRAVIEREMNSAD